MSGAPRREPLLCSTHMYMRGPSCWPSSAVLLVLIGLYHAKMLPSGGAAAEKRYTLRRGLQGLREVIAAFFAKKHIWYYIAFIILYRLGEGRHEDRAALPQGRYGGQEARTLEPADRSLLRHVRRRAFLLGSLLAGYYIAARGLRSHALHALPSSTSVRGLRPAGLVPARVDGSSAAASSWSISATDSALSDLRSL